MRNNYYNLIQKYHLPDIFLSIEDLSYTKKCELLNILINKYDITIVRAGLYTYQKQYIESDQIDIRKVRGHLIYCCRICIEDKKDDH
jgi:hypothetical protein